jgi:hypothetical protein
MSVRRLDLVNRPGGLKDRFRARCAEANICDDGAMCSGPLHFSVTDCTYPLHVVILDCGHFCSKCIYNCTPLCLPPHLEFEDLQEPSLNSEEKHGVLPGWQW